MLLNRSDPLDIYQIWHDKNAESAQGALKKVWLLQNPSKRKRGGYFSMTLMHPIQTIENSIIISLSGSRTKE